MEQFRQQAAAGDKDTIAALAQLMNASHDSLNTLYDCSHDNLNRLVEIGRNCGKVGIRLTGAGWVDIKIYLLIVSHEFAQCHHLKWAI